MHILLTAALIQKLHLTYFQNYIIKTRSLEFSFCLHQRISGYDIYHSLLETAVCAAVLGKKKIKQKANNVSLCSKMVPVIGIHMLFGCVPHCF